jgi:hypothetical protein
LKIKLVVGELRELSGYRKNSQPKNGFNGLMLALARRIDDETGELDLDSADINKLYRYACNGYKKRVLTVFGRTLASRL